MPETKDLILRKAVIDDWKNMFINIWSQPESAKYMVWSVTETEADAMARMERTIAYQAAHDYHWTVVEKASGQAIGWAGLEVRSEGVCGETGVALGPAFTGKGYGKQILHLLTDYARDQLGAKRFVLPQRKSGLKKAAAELRFYLHTQRRSHASQRSNPLHT